MEQKENQDISKDELSVSRKRKRRSSSVNMDNLSLASRAEKCEQNKEELKNAEVTQEQIITNTKTAGVQMTLVPNKINDEKSKLMKRNAQFRRHRNISPEKSEIFTMQNIVKLNTILKLKDEKQKLNRENQQMIENNVPYLENTSKVSEVVKDSSKHDITPLILKTMEGDDYGSFTYFPSRSENIAKKSNKSLKSLKEDKKSNKDFFINLIEDFDTIKNILNITTIKISELLEDLKTNDL